MRRGGLAGSADRLWQCREPGEGSCGRSEVESSGAADQAGGDVQQPVAPLFGFGSGQSAVHEQQPGPGEQVAGEADELDPHGVDVELAVRQVSRPGALGASDPVLDPGVGPVPGLEVAYADNIYAPETRPGVERDLPTVELGQSPLFHCGVKRRLRSGRSSHGR